MPRTLVWIGEVSRRSNSLQYLVLAKARAEAFKNGPPADFAQVAAQDFRSCPEGLSERRASPDVDARCGQRSGGDCGGGLTGEDVRELFGEWPLLEVGYLDIDVFGLHPYHGFGGAKLN